MRFGLPPANLRLLALGSIVVALLLVSTHALAEVPRAVSLLYFRGRGLDRAITLEWATATELNTAGYRLERAEASGGPFQILSQIGIIPAIGDSLQGAEYNATDRSDLQNGNVYWYKLVEIEFDGSENPIGPISITAGYEEPTATTDPGPTAQPSATGQAAAASATISPTPTGSATPPATSSPTATLLASEAGLSTAASARNSPTPSLQVQAAGILAQAGTPVSGTAYPGPPGATLVPPVGAQPTSQEYPPAGADQAAQPTEPYPMSIERDDRPATDQPVAIPTGTLAALIGEVSETLPVQDPEPQTPASNSLLLWVGFFVALMIFIAAVVGSILYFRR